MTFDIREFTDKLTRVSGQKYFCPVCNNNNLSIEPKTGKYQCWDGCENKDIREAVSPSIQKKEIRPAGETQYIYRDREGKLSVRVTRIDYGNGRKRFYQSSWNEASCDWEKGLSDTARQKLTIYRYEEVREAIAANTPIFLVEGESVVDCLWNLGLAATTTLGGAGKYRKYVASKLYKQDLAGALLILCPDRDEPGLKHMEEIALDFPEAKWLYAPPSDFYWSHLPKHGGLDLKDWVLGGATAEQILQAIEDRRVVVDKLERSLLTTADNCCDSRSIAKSAFLKYFNLLNAQWGKRLRLNEMTQKIELDGEALKLDRACLKIAREFDVDMEQEKAIPIINEIAEENSYSPVREYLESVAAIAQPINLDDLAQRYFGTSNPLHSSLLKRTLIAAVARVFNPGCKVDTLCILQGGQGYMKSTFWRSLTGENWFTDNLNDANEKDEKLKLRRYWVLEFSEFETAYKRKEVEQLKAFLSSQVDSLRRPYGRDIEDFPRTSIFVGTTNRQEFLHDPTGERRYWVIPVKKSIPISTVAQERSRIWATAVHLYREGVQWWLTREEDALLAEANQDWQSNDVWETAILDYLQHRDECTIAELLTNAIKIDLGHQSKSEQMRASDILRRNGWKKSTQQKRFDGRRQWFWQRVVEDIEEVVTKVVTEVVTEVVTPSNPMPETVSAKADPPVTTFSENFFQNNRCDPQPVANTVLESGKSFKNTGIDTSAKEAETPLLQGLENVTTIMSPPQKIPNVTAQISLPINTLTQTDIEEFADYIRVAIADPSQDPEVACAAGKLLSDAFANNPDGKRQVWAALTVEEKAQFKALLQSSRANLLAAAVQGKEWNQIREAIATVPQHVKEAAWALLSPEEQARIKSLKIKVGDRVRFLPQWQGGESMLRYGKIGKVQHWDKSQEGWFVRLEKLPPSWKGKPEDYLLLCVGENQLTKVDSKAIDYE